MKLAFCLFNYFPFGGLQRDFLRIAEECVQRGHIVDVYTMQWEGEKNPRIAVKIIPAAGLQNHTRRKNFVAGLQKELVQAQYDLVVGFNKMPGLDIYYAADTCYQAKAEKKPGWFYKFTPRHRQLVNYEKAVFAHDAKTEILLLAKKQQKEFIRFYATAPERFHLLPPGIAKNRIAPANAIDIRHATRKEFAIHEHEFLLLMVGSGFKTKGLARVLRGLAALPEHLKNCSQLMVIGKDNPKIFIRQAKRLGILNKVKFLGGREDVQQIMLAADLLVHPAYNENTGTVLLEAIVSGLPVLTTDVCGYAHYVHAANAGMVMASPFRQQQFNEILADMLLSPLRDQWHRNGSAFAKQADIYSLPQRAVDFIEAQSAIPRFEQIMSLQGEVYRELEGRRTQRITINGKNYFIKQHFGIGWKEIFKNLFQLRLPVTSAKNEWHAIQRLQSLAIPVPEIVDYGCRGHNPAHIQSFLITKELPKNISLEDFCRNWKINPPAFQLKRALINNVAQIARTLHENGVNHRDFYLCHFLLDRNSKEVKLYLIDLHRAQIRRYTPTRWIIKDLAGLYFSSKDIGLTTRDLLRFAKEYRKQPLRDIALKESAFWQKVKKRGEKIYQKHK